MKKLTKIILVLSLALMAGCLSVSKVDNAPRIGIAYASKRDQNRKWRFTLREAASTAKCGSATYSFAQCAAADRKDAKKGCGDDDGCAV